MGDYTDRLENQLKEPKKLTQNISLLALTPQSIFMPKDPIIRHISFKCLSTVRLFACIYVYKLKPVFLINYCTTFEFGKHIPSVKYF